MSVKKVSLVGRGALFAVAVMPLFLTVACGGGGAIPEGPADTALMALLNSKAKSGRYAEFRQPRDGEFDQIPQDPKNRITLAKVELGRLLYHETGLGLDHKRNEGSECYSCASCHFVQADFQAGRFQGIGEGGLGFGTAGEGRVADPAYAESEIDCQAIKSPPVLNVAYQPNMLWNGQFGATGVNLGTQSAWTAGTPKEKNFLGFEGVETQAIAGQGVHRLRVDTATVEALGYKTMFDAAFPEVAESIRYTPINAGLAIAAYERTILTNQSPFQRWLRGDFGAMTAAQKSGATIFFGKGGCVTCHTGPALSSMTFHGLGLKDLYQHPGALLATGASPENRGRGAFTGNATENYKFKTPQMYNLRGHELGHGSSFTSLRDFHAYLNAGTPENGAVPGGQLSPLFVPLGLSEAELDDLTEFVANGLFDPYLSRYVPDRILSGYAFPNNDAQSRDDMGL